jgi:hypothetical protein
VAAKCADGVTVSRCPRNQARGDVHTNVVVLGGLC